MASGLGAALAKNAALGGANKPQASLGAALQHNQNLGGGGNKPPTSLGAALQHNAGLGGPAKPAVQHGIGGFFHNLASGAEGAVSGLGPAVGNVAAHTAKELYFTATGNEKAAKTEQHTLRAQMSGIPKSYAHTYGPLFHGKFDEFAHRLYADPFGPILDAATVATLGAGSIAKAGGILAKAGAISDTSRLATLGKATDLTVPNYARTEDVIVKRASANPLIRARQTAINTGLNRLPLNTPVVGSAARATKVFARTAQREGARLALHSQEFGRAFARLSPTERLAWHLEARQLSPGAYKAFLLKQGSKASPSMLKLLSDPKLAEVMAKPSKNLAAALEHGNALSEHLTNLKVQGGHLDALTAAEAPYRHLRIVNGATRNAEGVLVDKPGREIPVLARELEQQGKQQPFHVPDSARTSGKFGYRGSKPSGFAAPPVGVKASRGVLFSKGLINPNENSLLRGYSQFKDRAEAQMLHDELVKHAAVLPPGEVIPHGYTELKLNPGEASAPYTAQVGGRLEHELGGDRGPAVGTRRERLIVPTEAERIVRGQGRSFNGRLAQLSYHYPTSVWKHLVLGLRPAFFGNITIGNSILGTLQMAPGRFGVAGWLNHVVPGAEKILGSKLDEATMKDVFPEQAMGTFGHSVGMGGRPLEHVKAVRVAHRLAQGVMPQTIAVENVLRRAMAEGWAKWTPEVRDAMHANGGDVNAALRQVAKSHPQIINEISRRIDDALGNYRTYNQTERAIKAVIPFYGWNRHVIRSVNRLALERPAVLDALYQEGTQGKELADKILGALPSYLEGSVKLPGLPSGLGGVSGTTPVLSTHQWNPFNTLIDTAKLTGLPLAKPGSIDTSLPINPIVQALLESYTGKSLLTGAPVKGNVPERLFLGLPQTGLIPELAHKSKPTSITQTTEVQRLLNLLGVPVKNVNLPAAHAKAKSKATGH